MGLIINGIADLTKDNTKTAKMQEFTQRDNMTDVHEKYKVGQIIEFWAGYYNNIRYRAEILCFDTSGEIYIIWDCWWSSIKDDTRRDIKLFK